VQIKNRQQLLTIVALAAIGIFAFDKIVRPPLMKLWSDRAQEIKDLRSEVTQGELLKRSRDSIRSRWAQIQASALTNNTSMAEQQLFKGFDRWSQSSGVSISSIIPQWKQTQDSDYKTLEIRVDASGSIDRLSRFLYDVERDPMALKLQSVELTARDNEGQVLAMGLQVSGLVLTPKEQSK
jgi:Tfp pilus assembly protein PilO